MPETYAKNPNNVGQETKNLMTEKSDDPYKNMDEKQVNLLENLKDAISMSGLLNNSRLPKEKQDEFYRFAKNTALDLFKLGKYDETDIIRQVEKYIAEKVSFERNR